MRRISVVAKGIKTVYLDDPRGKNARLSRSVAHQCAVSPFYRRVFASLIVSLCVASGVAGAVSDCEKELPIADTIGQFPWADKTYSTPTDMLRDACPEGHPLIESTVRMWDT